MTWYHKGSIVTELPEDCVGFVYLISCNTSGRLYIGKKLAKFSKTTYKTIKLKNGTKKKKKIRSKIDSDWQEYYGSNLELNKETSYIEAREQFDRKVLESDEYYNGQISVRVHGSHIKSKI